MKQYLKNTFWLGLLGALVLIFLATTGKDAEAGVRDISNVSWRVSVNKGKEWSLTDWKHFHVNKVAATSLGLDWSGTKSCVEK